MMKKINTKNERNLVLAWLEENRFVFVLLGEKVGTNSMWWLYSVQIH